MLRPENWLLFLVFFSVGIMGLTVSAILFLWNRERSLVSNLLATLLATLALVLISNALYQSNFYLVYPSLWRSMAWTSFCIGPLAFLYVRSVLEQSFTLRRMDPLFFLPAVLYFLHRLPFDLMDREAKLQVVTRAMKDVNLVLSEPEGFLPTGLAAVLRLLVGISFLIAQVVLLTRWRRRVLSEGSGIGNNRDLFRWLVMLTLVLSSSYVVIMVETFIQLWSGYAMGLIIASTIAFTILFIAIYLLARPVILYGMSGWLQESTAIEVLPSEEVVAPPKGKKISSLTLAQGLAYKKKVETHFNTLMPFREGGYTIADLARETDIPVYQLSAFIHQEYGRHFSDFINDARFEYLNGRMRHDPRFFQYSLEALARDAGFNSRTSFINAVKKRTGKTPSEYFVPPEAT